MHVVIPYVDKMLRDETREACDRLLHGHRYVMLDQSDSAYADLLCQLWKQKETFAIIEQDIVINHYVPRKWAQCSDWWCGFPYQVNAAGPPIVCLGCTKFGAQLLAREPDAMEEAVMIDDGLPPRHWQRLDGRIGKVLAQRDYRALVHTPPVRHLHDYC